MSVTGHWYRCPDGTTTSTCTAVTGASGLAYTPVSADWHNFLRYRKHGVDPAGSADAWSWPAGPVQSVPSVPTAPGVTAVGGGLQIFFPQAGFGATHWLLSLDGKQMVPIPVGTETYWLLNLVNGHPYQLSLAAADVAGASTVTSTAFSFTAVPMAGPSTPYVVVTGTSALFQLPPVPAGAQAWLLVLDGVTTTVAAMAATWTSPALATGASHVWALAPAAGSNGSGGWGSVGAFSSGTFAALDTPAMPAVHAVYTGADFAFPILPVGATGWQLTVGPRTYPVTSASTMTVTGFASGYSASWSLRAVNANARSVPVSGRFLPA